MKSAFILIKHNTPDKSSIIECCFHAFESAASALVFSKNGVWSVPGSHQGLIEQYRECIDSKYFQTSAKTAEIFKELEQNRGQVTYQFKEMTDGEVVKFAEETERAIDKIEAFLKAKGGLFQ